MMRKSRGNGILVCPKMDGAVPKMSIARAAYLARFDHKSSGSSVSTNLTDNIPY